MAGGMVLGAQKSESASSVCPISWGVSPQPTSTQVGSASTRWMSFERVWVMVVLVPPRRGGRQEATSDAEKARFLNQGVSMESRTRWYSWFAEERPAAAATLAPLLEARVRDAAAAWPDLKVPIEEFVRFLARRLPNDAELATALETCH